MTGWNAGTSAGGDPGAVTILEGATFCVSSSNGDMVRGFAHGWFHRDTRALSRFNLLVNAAHIEPLDVYTHSGDRAVFLGRLPHPAGHESTLIVERDRTVGAVLREEVTVRNYAAVATRCTLHMRIDSDFADLFDVKGGRTGPTHTVRQGSDDHSFWLESTADGVTRRVTVACPGASLQPDGVRLALTVPAKGAASATFTVVPSRTPADEDHPGDRLRRGDRLREDRKVWLDNLPLLKSDDEDVESALHQCLVDLAALRIEEPTLPGHVVVAAGAPWFMTLFGRDSILTSILTLSADRTLALGTAKTLALLQGSEFRQANDEEPGRILHEVRHGVAAEEALGGTGLYYGTADATPLFVHLVGELHRWGGLTEEDLETLLPHTDRALQWVLQWGDRDGDGFVEYARHSEKGLINQGWKDSWDGVNFADGTLAEGPIALCEVQGYVYRAWLDRAMLARHVGDDKRAAECEERAHDLREAFNRRFWLEDRGWFAIALDGSKRPVDALTSNIGHCLWSGIVDEDKAESVAAHLVSPALFSGWGVRTLAEGMWAFNPVSYHNGSVWPHDNAIVAHGLMRYGFVAEATRVASAVLEAAVHFRGRVPELYCGFDRRLHPEPIAYPTSCSPQAWAAATPIHLLRVLLRLDADVPQRRLRLSPVLPADLGTVRVENLPLGGGKLTFTARGRDILIDSCPPALRLSASPLGA